MAIKTCKANHIVLKYKKSVLHDTNLDKTFLGE